LSTRKASSFPFQGVSFSSSFPSMRARPSHFPCHRGRQYSSRKRWSTACPLDPSFPPFIMLLSTNPPFLSLGADDPADHPPPPGMERASPFNVKFSFFPPTRNCFRCFFHSLQGEAKFPHRAGQFPFFQGSSCPLPPSRNSLPSFSSQKPLFFFSMGEGRRGSSELLKPCFLPGGPR